MTIEPCVRTLTTSPPVLISPKKNAGLSLNNWPSLSEFSKYVPSIKKLKKTVFRMQKKCFYAGQPCQSSH